jgi:hypothetical protein
VTKKYCNLTGHIRAAYWLNGKIPDTDAKVGDMFEYVLVADYAATKTLSPQLALSGYMRDKTQLDGTPVDQTEVSQHTVNALLLWKPLPMLVVRPKVAFPLTFISKGGSMANWYGGLDVWVTLP